MATKTIYADTLLNFGKHRGKAVADVLATDPGYFLWLREAGIVTLDVEVSEVVNDWGAKNPGEVKKVVYSAKKARDERRDSPYVKAEEKSVTRDEPKPVPPQPKVEFKPSHEAWGVWG